MSPFCPPLLSRALLVSAAAGAPLMATAPAAAPPAVDVAVTSPAVSGFDAALVRDINNARASRGMRRLSLVAGATDVAHRWSCHLARYRTLTHNAGLAHDLSLAGLPALTSYGENIGWQADGYGADHMFRRYMSSAAHRANILNRSYRYVGVWTKHAGGRRWNTTDFAGAPAGSYHYSYGVMRVTC